MTTKPTTTTALANFTPMDLDELDAQEKQIGFGASGGNFFQFKDGRNVIRVLPGLNGQRAFIPYFKHFVKGAEGGKMYGGPCPLKMAKQPCVVCAVATRLSRGTNADRDLAGDLSARSRVVANVIDRSAPDAGPQVAEFGTSVYNAIKDIKRSLGDDPTHPTEGFDLVIEKSGSGMKTEYKVVPMRQSSPIHADARQMTEWLNEAPDLAMQVVLLPEHEQAAKLTGTILGPHLSAPASSGGKRARAADARDVDDGGENY
jgi:hypothetical protein